MTKQEFIDKYGIEPHKSILRGDSIATAALVECKKHKVVPTEYGISYCEKCEDDYKKKPIEKKVTYEMIPERIKEERKKYVTDQIQSHRQGELSREFVEAYPDKIKGMVKDGVLTREEVRKSKNVWKGDIPNWGGRKRKINADMIK